MAAALATTEPRRDQNLRDVPRICEKIEQRMKEGKQFFSFEYFPPKTPAGVDNLHARIDRMSRYEPLFCDITWGARGSTANLTLEIAGNIQKYHGLDCMMHLTCTNMPANTAKEALKEAKDRGLHNILALRGDPAEGENWEAAEGGFEHGVDLVKFIRQEYGDYFSICVAGYPEGHPDGYLAGNLTYEQEMENLKAKVDAGANFIITQMFFDADGFLAFVKRCREIGIKVPILPGILPLMNYGGFQKMTGFCKTKVPHDLQVQLEKVKDDESAVKQLGINYAIDMCRKILKSGLAPGLHFYTLNLEQTVASILDGLGLVSSTESIRSLPWRPSTWDKRRNEKVRPVYWANRFKSYLYRTSEWEKYPELQWNSSAERKFTEPPKHNLIRNEDLSEEARKKLHASLGDLESIDDVKKVFIKFFSKEIPSLPWSEVDGLSPETSLIAPQLIWMNKLGYLTINSQPRVNGALSSDPVVGWGAKNGYVYQKPYVEFFAPRESVNSISKACKLFPTVSMAALSRKDDHIVSNVPYVALNAVTWGVFPNSEVVQPSVLDPVSFKAWRDEAFEVWTDVWGGLYEPNSRSREIIDSITESYSLVSLVDNDFVRGDVFRVIEAATKA
mmetsp:Transcript_8247/g.24787  ORF Transcript_8247/g.24787 Transcript_8247/m.24787 type:complete len:617 (-) Transcript_8247:127-1977(-)